MFTGIIEARGRVVASVAQALGRRLTLDVGDWCGRGGRLAPGDSVAVSGVCLTLAEADPPHLGFDVIAETLARSTLADLAAGDSVNLESAMIASTPVGGHFVQGHVDGIGRIEQVRGGAAANAKEYVLVVRPPAELLDYLPPKGSVALDGVSLTIASVGDEAFEVALIPTTLEQTTLGTLKPGDRLNIETDMLARAAVHWLRRQGAGGSRGVNWRTLREAGFVD